MSEQQTSSGQERVILVDGSGFIFRAYHGIRPLSRKDGTPVNAVFGFCNMLYKLLEDAKADLAPTHFAVIFDSKRETFRNAIYAEYKAHRPPAPEDLIPQFDIIRQAVKAFNIPSIEMEGFEADDIIATYATQAKARGAEVIIVSTDKDLMQLVGDGVSMLDTFKNRVIHEAEVLEKFGVGPNKVVDVQALCGDTADNVPGVPGIGIKTAAQLINEYGDLESLLSKAEEIKQKKRRENLIEFAELARISRQLVELRQDVPLVEGIDDLSLRSIEAEPLLAFLKEQEFKNLAAKIATRHADELPEGATAEEAVPMPETQVKVDKVEYSLVQDLETLERWVAEASLKGLVAVDTETTSLNAAEADLVGISLSYEPGKACYIPLGHRKPKEQGAFDFGEAEAGGDDNAPQQIPLQAALDTLQPLLSNRGVMKVGQNFKYDLHVLNRYGVEVSPIDDTMLLSYVLDAGLHGHGMDELSESMLEIKPISYKEVCGTGKNQITFDLVPLDKACDYAAEDADITLRLYTLLKPRLLAEQKVTVYETIERPLIQILSNMEQAGVKVNQSKLAEMSVDFDARMQDLVKEIHQVAGTEFNVGSPKQLGEILFEKLELPGGKKSKKTGAWGTGADVLEGLAHQHELPKKVLDWRQLSKLKSTYTDALQKQINARTGRVHTSFSMAATTTGRLASSDPNLQNIPIRSEEGRKIREAFVAEPGNKLICADYSQIELRLLAHIAGIETLKQAFNEGQDIHALTASQVFNVPLEGMDPMVRRQAKAINFGIIYGMSAFGLSQQLGIPQREAKAFIEAYFEHYPGIRKYMDKTIEFCKANGYVETLYGRHCHIAGMTDKNPARRNFGERAAINAPIQGTAADIIKRAMIRVPGALEAAGLQAKMLLQVHDELMFEVPEAEVEQTAAVVKEVMESAATLDVPLVVDVGIGDSWAEAH